MTLPSPALGAGIDPTAAPTVAAQVYISLVSLAVPLASGRLSLPRAVDLAAERGFGGIEVLDRQLSALDGAEIAALRDRCTERGCGVVVDAGCDLTLAGPAAAHRETEHLRAVIAQAARLGCDVVRVAIGGQRLSIQKWLRRGRPESAPASGARGTIAAYPWVRRAGYALRSRAANFTPYDDAKCRRAARALDRVLPFAEQRGISLAVENHWGISSRPEWVLRILEGVRCPNIGTCPDFGNFPSRADRYEGLALLAPRALHVQAKCWRFGPDGEERTIDFGRCTAILRGCGYDRPVAIEYEGGGDGLAGSARGRDLILRHW